jgi:hypothetical protein
LGTLGAANRRQKKGGGFYPAARLPRQMTS